MRVDPNDGTCRSCGGELEIVAADDATMTVDCLDCDESYLVEPDSFVDGAIHYYPHFLAEQLQEGGDDDDA